MSDWASSLVSALMQKQGSKDDQQLLIGHIASINPVTIKMYDQIVSKYVYIDPSYTYTSSDQIDAALARTEDVPDRILNFLKSSLKQQLIKTGDTVIVLRDGVSFYVLSRMVSR